MPIVITGNADRGVLQSWNFEAFGFITGGSPGSLAWPSANLALAVPVAVNFPVLVTKFYVYNGATAADNLDIGIYDAEWHRLVSTGSTAQVGISANQVVDVTDTWLLPGLYYLALAMDGTTGTVTRFSPDGRRGRAIGAAQMGSALPLPATFVPAAWAQSTYPLFGALGRRTTL